MITKEEKRRRAVEREQERKAMAQKFPGATLHGGSVWVIISDGDEEWLEVQTSGNPPKREFILLKNIGQLGNFILALVARYNVAVSRANETARKSTMIVLEPIQPSGVTERFN